MQLGSPTPGQTVLTKRPDHVFDGIIYQKDLDVVRGSLALSLVY